MEWNRKVRKEKIASSKRKKNQCPKFKTHVQRRRRRRRGKEKQQVEGQRKRKRVFHVASPFPFFFARSSFSLHSHFILKSYLPSFLPSLLRPKKKLLLSALGTAKFLLKSQSSFSFIIYRLFRRLIKKDGPFFFFL